MDELIDFAKMSPWKMKNINVLSWTEPKAAIAIRKKSIAISWFLDVVFPMIGGAIFGFIISAPLLLSPGNLRIQGLITALGSATYLVSHLFRKLSSIYLLNTIEIANGYISLRNLFGTKSKFQMSFAGSFTIIHFDQPAIQLLQVIDKKKKNAITCFFEGEEIYNKSISVLSNANILFATDFSFISKPFNTSKSANKTN